MHISLIPFLPIEARLEQRILHVVTLSYHIIFNICETCYIRRTNVGPTSNPYTENIHWANVYPMSQNHLRWPYAVSMLGVILSD